jgi:hypothetical protein
VFELLASHIVTTARCSALVATLALVFVLGCGHDEPSASESCTTSPPVTGAAAAECPFGSSAADDGRCRHDPLPQPSRQEAGHDFRLVRAPLVQYWMVRGEPLYWLIVRLSKPAKEELELSIEDATAEGIGSLGYDRRSRKGNCYAAEVELAYPGVGVALEHARPGQRVRVSVMRLGRATASIVTRGRLRPALPQDDVDGVRREQWQALGCDG